MKTTDFPWYSPSFAEYNAAQAVAVPFLDKDVNLVISFPTASGKTAIGEAAMAYHLATNQDCRVAYVCPFKSLASEKFQAWTAESQLGKYGIALWSSDSDDEGYDARLIVATLESFDSKTRSDRWERHIGSLSCVIMDEAHIIGDSPRGGAMEAAMMRLTEKNPSVRLILLSATMGNAGEIAKWVKSLNGKQTKSITSSWRPTKVQIEYDVISGNEEKVCKAVELAKKSSGQKTLVFVHSKITGRDIVKRLRKQRVRAVFHNASLSAARRRKIESIFGDSSSGLNTLVSTSTLGSGVNLN